MKMVRDGDVSHVDPDPPMANGRYPETQFMCRAYSDRRY